MASRKTSIKSFRPKTLSEAAEACLEHAAKKGRPAKVMADLMGVELKTLYRWQADTSMPLNRIRQFETFCGASYISDYLCLAHGNKVVIDIPTGKRADITDLAELQGNFAEALALLARFYRDGNGVDETISALTLTLSNLAYQRSNVQKSHQPELSLFGDYV